MLPNFICPGEAKCGTTTLYNILKQHTDIYLPEAKEPFLFVMSEWEHKVKNYESKHYAGVSNESVIGDMTTWYLYPEYVPQRIYNTLGPDVKFVILLRNPVDRAFSHYLHRRRKGEETKKFEKAISLEKKRLAKSRYNMLHYSYLDRGYYSSHIKNYLKFFPAENFRYFLFEEFIGNPEKVAKEIFRFLDIDENQNIDYNIHSNKSYMIKRKYAIRLMSKRGGLAGKIRRILSRKLKNKLKERISKPSSNPVEKIDIKTAQSLMQQYTQEIHELEELIGRDLSIWIDKYDIDADKMKGKND
jgi:hypothetical protein